MIRFIFSVALWLVLGAQAEILRVAIHQPVITTTVPKKDFTLGTTVFMKEITEKEGIETVITYYDDPKKLGEDFNSGKIDYIAADALTITQNIPISNLINGIMSFKRNKTDSQTLLILGLADDSRPLKEKLRGDIASDGDACSELYLKTMILQNGLPETNGFLQTKNSQQSILKLFFKKADIAIIDRASYDIATELNPQLKQKLTILESVPLTIGPIAFMRKGLSPITQKKIISLGKQLNTTPRGKQLLQLFRASYMDDSNTEDLKNIYALHNRYEALRSAKSAKGKTR